MTNTILFSVASQTGNPLLFLLLLMKIYIPAFCCIGCFDTRHDEGVSFLPSPQSSVFLACLLISTASSPSDTVISL